MTLLSNTLVAQALLPVRLGFAAGAPPSIFEGGSWVCFCSGRRLRRAGFTRVPHPRLLRVGLGLAFSSNLPCRRTRAGKHPQ